MKKMVLILLAVLSSTLNFAQWNQLQFPTTNNLHCVRIIDSLTYYVAGDSGKVYKTLDGGTNWFDLSPSTDVDWYSMYFIDNNYGWVAGRRGTVARTTNGGSSWEISSLYNSSLINVIESIYFADKNIGYLSGGIFTENDRETYIFKTSNGGLTWELQANYSGGVLLEMSFTDQNNGYVVGTNGGVFKTTDAGNSWNSVFINTGYWLRAVNAFDETNVIALGQYGKAWKTFNGGNSWTSINTSVSNYIEACSFRDKYEGWAVGEYGLCIYTTNGGNSWTNWQLPTTKYLWSIDTKDKSGLIVGDNGTIYKLSYLKTLKIDKPNGGEILRSNYYYQIKWTKNFVDKVYLDYSTNNGSTWNIIDINVSGNTYNWFVPNVNSTQCLIRLTEVADPTNYVISDSNFIISTTVDVEHSQIVPDKFSLFQNHPNPFNPNCKIGFTIPNSGYVRLEVFNLLGQKVKELVDDYLVAGIYEYDFNADELPSGIYLYRLKTERYTDTKKMIYLR